MGKHIDVNSHCIALPLVFGTLGVSLHHRMGTTLADRWKAVVTEWKARHHPDQRGEGYNIFDEEIGAAGGTTSRIIAGKYQDPSFDTLRRAAAAGGVTCSWLAFEEGPRVPGESFERLGSMAAITFLGKLLPLHRLQATVMNGHRKPWELRHLAQVIEKDLAGPGGVPVGKTWEEALDAVANEPPTAKRIGGPERVRAIMKNDSTTSGSQPVTKRAQRRSAKTVQKPARKTASG